MTAETWDRIAAAISQAIDAPFEPRDVRDLGGGCINRAVLLSDGRRSFFVKINEPSTLPMFQAERDGLDTLAAPGAVRVPAPVADGTTGDAAFLVLEYIPLSRLTGRAWSRLGGQLAAVHRTTAEQFGWHRSNTIGSTPQCNDRMDSWIEFWRVRRLGYQLRLAAENGLPATVVRDGERLQDRLSGLFAGYEPQPSLLHGDLWSGNVAADENGQPVLFDPAVYYGDRETDIAMSELFGRFDRRFYEAYQAAWPLAPGYELRRTLYNLYHILNHYNLFGGGYGGQAGVMIKQLLDVS